MEGALLIVMLATLAYEIRCRLIGKDSENWEANTAKALKVFVRSSQQEGGEKSFPSIRYEYSVLGTKYVGTKYAYGNIFSSDYWETTKSLRGIYAGGEVEIYVNPKNPRQSVLVQGYMGNFLPKLIGILAFLVIFLSS